MNGLFISGWLENLKYFFFFFHKLINQRFKPELSDGANAGLNKAQKFLEPIKMKYPNLSYSDLWILASYQAIEYMGGKRILFFLSIH